jgi:hypothetical protein
MDAHGIQALASISREVGILGANRKMQELMKQRNDALMQAFDEHPGSVDEAWNVKAAVIIAEWRVKIVAEARAFKNRGEKDNVPTGSTPDTTAPVTMVCTCSNGEAATGSACTSNGPKCASCNNGFKLEGTVCKAAPATGAAPTPATTAPPDTKFKGKISLAATGLKQSEVEEAGKAAVATHFGLYTSAVRVSVTKSRRLSAAPRNLADTWNVAYEFIAPSAKVAAVEAKVTALASPAGKAALESAVGTQLVAAGVPQSTVDSIVVTSETAQKAPESEQPGATLSSSELDRFNDPRVVGKKKKEMA